MEVVGLDEVVLLHISHKDEYLYEKLVDLLEESGYQVNHLQSRDSKAELFQFKELVIIPERHQVFLNDSSHELSISLEKLSVNSFVVVESIGIHFNVKQLEKQV